MIKSVSNIRWGIGFILLGSAITITLFGMSQSLVASVNESHEEREHSEYREYRSEKQRKTVTMSPMDKQGQLDYQQECGSCHLAYPPRMLPAVSWATMMSNLSDHFGENAELPAPQVAIIARYLVTHSAQQGDRVLRRSTQTAPLRITELPYFIRQHDEIPMRMVTDNPQVGGFSNCNACHQNAAKGDFDEDRVSIPGYGRQHF